MNKKIIAIVGSFLVILVVITGNSIADTSSQGTNNGYSEPPSTSGDCIPDGGYDSPNGPNGDGSSGNGHDGPAPNSGDGVPDGPGWP